MKRSDMQKEIETFINSHKDMEASLLANWILCLVIEAGMKPPRIWVDCESWSDEGSPKWDDSLRVEGEPLSGLVGWKKQVYAWEEDYEEET